MAEREVLEPQDLNKQKYFSFQDAVTEMKKEQLQEIKVITDDTRHLKVDDSTLSQPVRQVRNDLYKLKDELEKNGKSTEFKNDYGLKMQSSMVTNRIKEDIRRVIQRTENLDDLCFHQLFIQMAKDQGVVFSSESDVLNNDIDKAVKIYTKSVGVETQTARMLDKEAVKATWKKRVVN